MGERRVWQEVVVGGWARRVGVFSDTVGVFSQ